MDADVLSSQTAFNKLPIELNKAIAHYLETDADIASYQWVCKATRNATLGDNLSFWRSRFRQTYAYKEGPTNLELQQAYQLRQQVLRQGTGYNFFFDEKERRKAERTLLKVVKDLINESFQGPQRFDDNGISHCPNLSHIAKFVRNSRLFSPSKRPPKITDLADIKDLAAVKLMCAHFLLGSDIIHPVLGVDECQRAVYEPTNHAPIFIGENKSEINMVWLLQTMEFFRNHMTNDEMALFEAMQELPDSDKPSPWRIPLVEGCHALGKNWKGTFSFLDHPKELHAFRQSHRQQRKTRIEVFVDHYVDEGQIQDIELDFVSAGKLAWPDIFEARLQSKRNTLPKLPAPPPETRAQKHRPNSSAISIPVSPLIKYQPLQLTGSGIDEKEPFFASGWLQPLHPQCGIPGWQRMTLMKHFFDDYNLIDQDDLWAYEGVVLPGGRIILGRWWFATEEPDFDNDNCGPFILWAVDGEPVLDDEE